MKLQKIFFTAIFICIIVAVFGRWFLNQEIIGGDWQYLFDEMLKEFPFFPLSWDPAKGNGLGGLNPIYPLSVYNNFTIFIANYFHIQWVIVYKIFWFGLFIVLSILSSIVLLKITLSKAKYSQLFMGGIIFTSNTYILMIVGGGQMGVALAYSVAPLVLSRFILLIENIVLQSSKIKYQSDGWLTNIKYAIFAGLVLALQVMFDIRIAYITMFMVGLYFVFSISFYTSRKNVLNTLYLLFNSIAIPIGIAILLHASWLLPMLLFRQNPIGDLGESYTGSGIVQFLSFANFSDAFVLLHPNWPENIFGKVYFMRPEFLILPIIAYSSLLFLKNSKQIINSKFKTESNLTIQQSFDLAQDRFNNRTIVFFALLGLVGAFLAKGTNPPFGEFYIWLFNHLPGFVMFRDPTKFYVLVSLSYLVLIPFSIFSIQDWIKSKSKNQILKIQSKYKIFNFSYVFLLFTILYLIFLIHPAISGNLRGTFQKQEVPKEYIDLKNFSYNQPDFFRMLWIPSGIRFNYFDNKHLIVTPELLFGTKDIAIISKKLRSTETQTYLQALAIKYIIVPYDPLGEIFVKNRKYDEEQYRNTIEQLETLPWLKRSDNFGKIAVFEVSHPKDHFWLSRDGKISYKMISSVDYNVSISITKPQSLIFSENYSPSWAAISNSTTSFSKKTSFGLNSFYLPKNGNYDIKIFFTEEQYYKYGLIISIATLISIISVIIVFQKKKL